MMKMDGVRFQ